MMHLAILANVSIQRLMSFWGHENELKDVSRLSISLVTLYCLIFWGNMSKDDHQSIIRRVLRTNRAPLVSVPYSEDKRLVIADTSDKTVKIVSASILNTSLATHMPLPLDDHFQFIFLLRCPTAPSLA